MQVFIFLLGVFLGMPLGWAVLFCLALSGGRDKEPKSKEEWRVM